MNSIEAELKENESIYLENCCRLELMKRQNVKKNENFKFSKCRLQKLQQVGNKLFMYLESQHETLCPHTICFWTGYLSFK